MRIRLFPIRTWLAAIVTALQMAAAAATLPAAGCSPTAAHASIFVSLPVLASGYRIIAVHWDPLLKQRWAIVGSCEHPERPSFTVKIADMNIRQAPQNLFPVIHSGDLVKLICAEPMLRIAVSAVAEENGAVGGHIRVRLLRSTAPTEDGFAAQPVILEAIVRGPREVEVER